MTEKYNNKRLVFRNKGKYTKPNPLNCKVCPKCKQIIPPETINEGSKEFPLLKTIYPQCPNCNISPE